MTQIGERKSFEIEPLSVSKLNEDDSDRACLSAPLSRKLEI